MIDKTINKNNFFNIEPIALTPKLLNINELLKAQSYPTINIISNDKKIEAIKSSIQLFRSHKLILKKLPYIKYAIIEYCSLENNKKTKTSIN